MKQLRAHLADAGRDPASFPIGKRVYIAVDRDRARAAKRLAEWFGAFYGNPVADEISAFGDVDACVEGLHAIIAGGARCPLLNPVFDELEHPEHFAAEIVPHL